MVRAGWPRRAQGSGVVVARLEPVQDRSLILDETQAEYRAGSTWRSGCRAKSASTLRPSKRWSTAPPGVNHDNRDVRVVITAKRPRSRRLGSGSRSSWGRKVRRPTTSSVLYLQHPCRCCGPGAAEEEDPGTAGTEVYKIAQRSLHRRLPGEDRGRLDRHDHTGGAHNGADGAHGGRAQRLVLPPLGTRRRRTSTRSRPLRCERQDHFGSMTNTVLGTLDGATLALDRQSSYATRMQRHSTPQKRGSAGALRNSPLDHLEVQDAVRDPVSGYTPTEIAAIKEKHGNVVVSQGGILHTTEGTVLSGEFIDVIRSRTGSRPGLPKGVPAARNVAEGPLR